ncbi:hypothetical protein [Azohydromonas sediminis]|uniref:hypothetical protein n=1 Tax=Azohydromonas sediminis TaxID=2259674 RepID=UPI000E65A329|nr:hypothetical protein [Azohydromonas sediminis]
MLAPAVVAPTHDKVACVAADGRLLVFGLDELKLQPNGGRGLTLMDVDAKTPLLSVTTLGDALTLHGRGRGDKAKDAVLRAAALAAYVGRRARKGRKVEGFRQIERLTG